MHIWKLPQKDLIWKKKTDTSLTWITIVLASVVMEQVSI